MKKQLCLILSIMLSISVFAPCQSVIAAQVNKHSIGYFSDSLNEIIDIYDSDEDYISDSESDQKIIKDRLIVSPLKIFALQFIRRVILASYSIYFFVEKYIEIAIVVCFTAIFG